MFFFFHVFCFSLGLIFFTIDWVHAQVPKNFSQTLNQLGKELIQESEKLETTNPLIVVLDIQNDATEVRDALSEKAEALLIKILNQKEEYSVVSYPQIQTVRQEWMEAFPDSSPDQTRKNLADLLGADWVITGSYRTAITLIAFRLQLYDALTNQLIWRGQTKLLPEDSDPSKEKEILESTKSDVDVVPKETPPSVVPVPIPPLEKTEVTESASTVTMAQSTIPVEIATTHSLVTETLSTSFTLSETSVPGSLVTETLSTSFTLSETSVPGSLVTETPSTSLPLDETTLVGLIFTQTLATSLTLSEYSTFDPIFTQTFLFNPFSEEWIDVSEYLEGNQVSEKFDEVLDLSFISKRRRLPYGEGMVFIAEGKFLMGSFKGENDERPVHAVHVDNYYLDIYEVTNAEYAKCSTCERGNGGFDTTKPEQPVVYVDWENANKYCRFVGKRLPTEAEWEKGVRAGSETEYVWGDTREQLDTYSWYEDNAGQPNAISARPVGLKQSNVWGLYDMHGNVMEWTNDWYASDQYQKMESNNPTGPAEPLGTEYPLRSVRGGAWDGLFGSGKAEQLRSAKRFPIAPWVRSFLIGFRCAASWEPFVEPEENFQAVEFEENIEKVELKEPTETIPSKSELETFTPKENIEETLVKEIPEILSSEENIETIKPEENVEKLETFEFIPNAQP